MHKRLRCYNQYPGLYQDFDSMRKDLQRIRHLGFDQVWVNPFYTPCQTNSIPNMQQKIHSPYAMQNASIYLRYAKSESMVVAYTKAAKLLGLTSMFDLVPRHVAIDNNLVSGDSLLLSLHHVDTRKWFKRYPNGNFQFKFMDENYLPTSANPWSDVASFDYDVPEIREQIMRYFWEPFLKYTIETLGFTGIRIDAPGMIPTEALRSIIDIAKGYLSKAHVDEPIILAETIGGFLDENLQLKGIATHTMNYVYWTPGPEDEHNQDNSLWRNDHNWFADIKGQLQSVGPSVGYACSHDEVRYMQKLKDNGIQNKNTLDLRMKERLAVAAFASDGGWILLYGDEFGVSKRINIFDTTPMEYHNNPDLQSSDYSAFIASINQTIVQLPKPTFPEWSQRVFLADRPNLVIFIIHQGWEFSSPPFVIVANFGNRVTLTHNDIAEIMLANGRNNSAEKSVFPDKLFLCGAVQPDFGLMRSLGEQNIYSSEKGTGAGSMLFRLDQYDDVPVSSVKPQSKVTI